MNPSQDKAQGVSDGSDGGEKAASSADVKQITHVIAALNLVRMNLSMYPDGHSQISDSLASAHQVLLKILTDQPSIQIGVAGGTLMAGEIPLDKRNTAVRDYAKCLTALRIVYFTLLRGIRKEDIFEFNRIVSSSPSDVWAQGNTETLLARAGISAIVVKTLDVTDFDLTEEKEIVSSDALRHGKDADFWFTLIQSFLNIDRDTPKTGKSNRRPVETIRVPNIDRESWPAVTANYEKILKDYFYEIRSGLQISAERYDDLSKINRLIHDLNPELKNQLLDIAGRQIALQSEDKLSLNSLIVFSQDMLEEMLSLMKLGESRISSSLIRLMQKMQDTERDIEIIGETVDEPVASKSEIKDLLRREQNEYVPDDYDKLLKESAISPQGTATPDDEGFPLAEHLISIADDHIDARICGLLLALLDEELPDTDYATYATNLSQMAPDLIRTGRFDELAVMIEALRRHGREKASLKIRQTAVAVLHVFSQAETVELMKAVILDGKTDLEALKKFLATSGPQNMTWLFDLYLDKSAPPSPVIVDILKVFGRDALDQTVKMLPGKDPQTVIRLLALIRAFNDRYILPAVKKGLFGHEDLEIRKELVKTLMQFDDLTAIDLIKRGLSALNREEVIQMVNLTCRYQIVPALEDVMSVLNTVVIREKNMPLYEGIVREMASAGNTAVIPYLERITAKQKSLTPSRLYRLQEIVYSHLNRYPPPSVKAIVDHGKFSRNKRIRELCAMISKDRTSL